ncbi:hypothetical protein HYPSUDRAFT_816934 [Hypholoma sublateritium FD-334 SS-4]|uniref:Uncharacterized protein n=1 Tax=Hypholoma sublateritium (strain FD-334 SS-4) TaxID=945553 RepID=A0A0D2NNC5_HYPSF|nr:hypothetical protein HYPSUDRAFT_816934 [Hypholoma sublateritium FD-334 SS-4]
MAPRAIELVFLGLSPRLYTLRALIISSLLIVSVNIEWTYGLWIALYAVVAVHQIISTFTWPILYGALELIFLIAEVSDLSTVWFLKA